MPPKKADPKGKDAAPVVVEEKDLSLIVKLVDRNPEPIPRYRVRVICDWMECCTLTESFGSPSIPWEVPPAEEPHMGFKAAQHRYEYNPSIVTTEQIESFNRNPGLYAVVLRQDEDDKRTPVSFVYLDCSEFLLAEGKQSRRSEIIDGVYVELTIIVKKAFVPNETAVSYDPLVVTFGKLTNYPKLDLSSLNSLEQAFDKVYLYGYFDLGVYSRFVFARPAYDASTAAIGDDGNPEKLLADFNLSTCILPGLSQLSVCHQKLMMSTYSVHLYDEDVCKRAFHERNIAEYQRLVQESSASTEAPAAGGKAGGKDAKAAPPKKGGKDAVPDVPPASTAPEVVTVIDQFLIACISNALKASDKVYIHGAARFRLDPLLRSSEDLLLEFQKRREGAPKESQSDNVILKDSINVEVRLEKPSKPIKWAMPGDISIKKMMSQSRDDDISKLNGTLAPILPSALPMNIRPRYELFFVNETSLKITAKLVRKLKHPTPEPSVLLKKPAPETAHTSPTKSDLRSGTPTKQQPASARRRSTTPSSDGTRRRSKDAAPSAFTTEWPPELYRKLKETPFTRMVFVFRYEDDSILSKINIAIAKVNSRALPDIQGSLRSYSFTPKEKESAIAGSLDVVTGFTIIDDDVRIVVLEGLAGPDQGMQSVFIDIPRIQEDNKNLKILCNPEVLFPSRLYADFGPDVKRIRVRDKLKKLARKPELYNRKQVEEITFSAVEAIMNLRRSPDLKSTKQLNLYPSADALSNLELLYGEAISIADLDGTEAEAQRKLRKANLVPVNMDPEPVKGSNALDTAASMFGESQLTKEQLAEQKRKRYADTRCAPTDCRNAEFEKFLRTKGENQTDYLEVNRQIRKKAWEDMLMKQAQLDNQLTSTLTAAFGQNPSQCKVFMYSTQALNYTEKAVNEMKKSLAKVKDASFTYNVDFNSQTVSAIPRVDSDPKADWLTPSGFQYPKPKPTKELIAHPHKPSEARIEDLKEPFDNSFTQQRQQDPHLVTLEKGYSVRFRPGFKDFNNLEPPVYDHEFILKNVGDKQHLPRGKMVDGNSINKDFFRSVHLGGDDALKIMEEAIAKEKADWKAAMVVDTLDFKVGGFKVRDKAIPVDRTNDILKDEPKTKALKHLRTMKSVGGKDYSYGPAPIGLMNQEEYIPNATGKALVRTVDETKFVTCSEETLRQHKRPENFTLYVNQHEFGPKLAKAISKRKHIPIDAHLAADSSSSSSSIGGASI